MQIKEEMLEPKAQTRDELKLSRQQTLSAMAEKRKMLKRLDLEILDKSAKRAMLIKEMGFIARQLVDFRSFCKCSEQELLDGWKAQHFESKDVQIAVCSLRSLLFDDSDPVCQAFDCIDIIDPVYDNIIKFCFSNGKNEFFLNIPTALYEEGCHIDNEVFGGKISISHLEGAYAEVMLMSSYSIDAVAESIKLLMHGKPIASSHKSERFSFIDSFTDASRTYASNCKVW